MEPGVLGETEALQQFFRGQDVRGVLDSSVAVDTSILEQYLSNDMDASSCMLPDSPPDSSSEACSPPQIPDFHQESPYWSNQRTSCRFKDRDSAHQDVLVYNQLHGLGLADSYVASGTPPVPPQHHRPQVYTPPTPQSPPTSNSYITPGLVPPVTAPTSSRLLGSASTLHTLRLSSPENKKRRRSECEEPSAAPDTSCGVGGSGLHVGSYQLLTWDQYRREHWSRLFDSSFHTLSPPVYHLDADKGFIYSAADEAFICQKKNHFQVTVHMGVGAEPLFVGTSRGTQQVDHFHVNVFGVKLEAPSHHVTIEQSQPDRSKKAFHPVRVGLSAGKVTKVTLGRLHFSETTSNNMRKKGKPNPDQRYFQMVVGLYAAVGQETFLLTALMSERIIVRASNPGQFETEGDVLWQRGTNQDSAVCQGRVGINTDAPDEALVVHGNAKVMGSIIQPSDCRVKRNIQEVDSEQQLRRITQMRLVEFDFKPEFACVMGMDQTHQTGVIAQEVKELLPLAVKEVGEVTCSDGEKIDRFLMVDKEQIFMENIGAVQHLSKLTDDLETRISDLEVWNRRLAKLKSLTGSLRSSGKPSGASSTAETSKSGGVTKKSWSQKCRECVGHKAFKAGVLGLLATMALCIVFITAAYFLNLTAQESDVASGNSNTSVDHATTTTAWTSGARPTPPAGPWPPDVDFCDLLYCEQMFCCPSSPRDVPRLNETMRDPPGPEKTNLTEKRKEKLYHNLKSAKDWTNTTIQTFKIKENQQLIDSRYCLRDECGPGRFIFRVPISPFVPVNMRVTLLMNSTEVLVVYLCRFDESAACSSLLDINTVTGSWYSSNTQGEHEWPLHVARLYHSSYHFRSSVAGQADCSTDHHYAGAFFTDYIFHFYRRCTSKEKNNSTF